MQTDLIDFQNEEGGYQSISQQSDTMNVTSTTINTSANDTLTLEQFDPMSSTDIIISNMGNTELLSVLSQDQDTDLHVNDSVEPDHVLETESVNQGSSKDEDIPQTYSESVKIPNIGDKIRAFDPDTDKEEEFLVTNRAGKVKGGNKHWYNVRNLVTDVKKSLNFENIQWTFISKKIFYESETCGPRIRRGKH